LRIRLGELYQERYKTSPEIRYKTSPEIYKFCLLQEAGFAIVDLILSPTFSLPVCASQNIAV
jgi:hypothetical protein